MDRELSRCGAGEEVARGDRVLEVRRGQPASLRDAKLPQKRDVRGRAAETDAADPAPLAGDREQARRRFPLAPESWIVQH